jgi:hypothetical protein
MSAYQNAIEGKQRGYADRAKRVSQLTLPLASYTGKYRNANFGDVDINIEANALSVTMGNMHVISTPFTQKETIRVELIPGTGQIVAFKINEAKQVVGFVYDGIEFRKVQ